MRHLIVLATGVFLITAAGQAVAGPFAPAGFSRADGGAPLVLVQDKPAKNETLTQKVKRAWRNIAGYKFDVNCPINSTAPAPKPARTAMTRAANVSRAIRSAGFPTRNSRAGAGV